MTLRPERILLVTERPLLSLNFTVLLEAAGLGVEHAVLGAAEFPHHLGDGCLAVIDSECAMPWDLLARLRTETPGSRFVIWCKAPTPQLAQAVLQAGLDGLLSIDLAVSEAAQSLVRICEGRREFRFDGELQTRRREEPWLTPRERQVVSLVMSGRKNREIAEALRTTEGSVKVYLHRIFEKTGATSRYELALVARELIKAQPTGPENEGAAPRASETFDAGWMFSGGSSSEMKGEISL
jgi:two-component system nitrate/nitrite response regulator NarL